MTYDQALASLVAFVERYMKAWNTTDHAHIIADFRASSTGQAGPTIPTIEFRSDAAYVVPNGFPGDPGTVRVDYADIEAHFTATHEQLALF